MNGQSTSTSADGEGTSKGLVKDVSAIANRDEDGIWRTPDGVALHVSASDIERHTYCPLSWHLASKGISGVGHAIESGIEKHKEIHELMKMYKRARIISFRETTIWSWWFTIILAFTIDAFAFYSIDRYFTATELARYLVSLGLIWLSLGISMLILPWREMIGFGQPTARKMDSERKLLFKPLFDSSEFRGGWSEGGKIEAGLYFAAIVSTLHGVALWWATDREQAGYILLMVALLWTLFAAWRLKQVLLAETQLDLTRDEVGLKEDSDVAYSDDSSAAELLKDEDTGLRGRPDQIVIIDGEFIPLEQKTGKIPRDPHLSHTMQLLAYLQLVEKNTGSAPPYGVLKYGESSIFQIDWDEEARGKLIDRLTEIQRLMVEGGAKRDHDRPGKCRNCSRKHACSESLA
ncbi:MAG: Dna2/Cas4 domain-containing protein [Candidatus Poseidoniaceae archaeon]|nr:Dna2/Cas4 domain-containing protein [Candidatus Poseidoniaceae archaeon]